MSLTINPKYKYFYSTVQTVVGQLRADKIFTIKMYIENLKYISYNG